MQESRIDDYLNIDGSRDLSDPWTGFTQFTLLEEKPPDGYMWSGERLTKRQETSRPDHLWPEIWKRDANSGKSVLMHTARVMYSLAKKFQKNGYKSAVAVMRNTRSSGCVFQDMEPSKSSSIFRKRSNMLKPIRCVQFTEAVLRHATIRAQKPSLGIICPRDPHQRNPNAPKFEDRSQEARRNGKSDVLVKQRGGWPEIPEAKGETLIYFLLTYRGSVSPCTI